MNNRLYKSKSRDEIIAEHLINQAHDKRYDDIIRTITNPDVPLSPKIVILAARNPDLNDFFMHNERLNIWWSCKLKKYGYPDFPIPSTNGETLYPVFDRFKGAFYWSEYNKIKTSDPSSARKALDRACQFAVNDAYIEKISILREELLKTGTPSSLTELIKLSLQFCESHWSAGYLNSGLTFLEIAAHFRDVQNDQAMSIALEAAIESFYTGLHLIDHPISSKIINSLYGDQGWEKIFHEYLNEDESINALTVKNHILNIIRENLDISNPDLFFTRLEASARTKTQQIINRLDENNPEIEYKM